MFKFFIFAIHFVTVSTVFATPFKRTTPDVLAAIAKVSTSTTKLDGLITNYPLTNGTLSGALDIHNNATALNSDLVSATTVVTNNGPIPHPDADQVLNAVLAIEPTIDHALIEIVNKKPAFVALPLGGLPGVIHLDLINLRASTQGFANALITNAPDDLVDEGTAYRDRLLAAFDVAIAAYA